MSSRFARRASSGLVLFLLLGSSSLLYTPVVLSAVGSTVNMTWVQPYSFRREVVVQNPGILPLSDYPILINLNFSQGSAFNVNNELRVYNSSAEEVPSFVVSQQASKGYVVAATILAFVNVPSESNTTLFVYYGYPGASFPPYREGYFASSVSQGLIDVNLGTLGSQSSVSFNYAETYSQTVEPVVSVGARSTNYGSSIFGGRLLQTTPWETLGNATSFAATVASASFIAGTLMYTQVEILSAREMISIYQLQNVGADPVDSAAFFLILNDSTLAALGPLSLSYQNAYGLSSASVSSAFLASAVTPTPDQHGIGTTSEVVSAVNSSTGNIVSPGSGADCALLRWSLGTLGAGQSATIRSAVSLSRGLNSTAASIQNPPRIKVGKEAAAGLYFDPTTTGFWNAGLSLSGIVVSSGGSQIPLQVANGSPVPGTASVTGTATFSLPAGGFSAGGGPWTRFSSSLGNATAYASPSFYSVSQGIYLGRVSAFTSDNTGAATADLTSLGSVAAPSSSAYLSLTYKASVSFSSGDPSQQDLFAAVNVYNGFSGKLESSIYFPVTGTSSPISYTGSCNGAPSQAGGGVAQPTAKLGGYLVGDGTWRSLTYDLTGVLNSGNAQFQILLCASESPGFVGQMEFEAQMADVTFTSPAQSIMEASISPTGSYAQLNFVRDVFPATLSAKVSITLNFETVSNTTMHQAPDGSFVSAFPEPSLSLNATRKGGSPVPLPLNPLGLAVYTSFFGSEPQLSVNGSRIGGSMGLNGIYFVSGDALSASGLGRANSSSTMRLVFPTATLSILIADKGGNPVGGALVVASSFSSAASTNRTSEADGTVTFGLVPWNYSVSALLGGQVVYTTLLNMKSDQSIRADASVYGTTLRVNDITGNRVGDGTVSITLDNSTQTYPLMNGEASLQFPAGAQFQVSVEVGGSQVYSGSLSAETNGATLIIGTSYLPQYIELVIATVVVASLVAVAAVLYYQGRFNFRLSAKSVNR